MTKKALTIAITVVILAIIGIAAWFFFLAPTAAPSGEEEESRGFFGFLPFGNGEVDNGRPALPPDIAGDVPEEEARAGAAAELKQLTTVPIAGAIATTTRSGLAARYLERQTGNVYDISPDGGARERITNTTVPAVREAFLSARGTEVLLRYLNENDVIRTFAARITAPGEEVDADAFEVRAGTEADEEETAAPTTSAPAGAAGDISGELVGNFLDDEISFVAPSPLGAHVFYLTPLGSGIIGTTASFRGTNKNQMFDSSFIEWLPQWPEEGTITLTTKASGFAEGFLYFLDADGGPLRKVLGNILGLTTLSNPSAERVVYSESADGAFTFHVFDIAERENAELPIATLPEKCAWSKINDSVLYCGVPGAIPSNVYPDVWYQGRVSFSDTLWRIDTETSITTLLAIPQTIARQEIDVVNPFLDSPETYLFFVNKKDSTLWSLKLE